MTELTVDLLPWQRWLKRLLLTLLTLLTAWLAAKLVWLVLAPAPLDLPQPSKVTKTFSNVELSSVPHDLFGEIGVEKPVETKKPVDAPDTRLRLELLGVNSSTVPELSSAIIAPKGGKGENYAIGDVIQGRTKLSDVYVDKVILDTSGKLETLKFDERKSSSPGVRIAPSEGTSSGNSGPGVDEDRIASLKKRIGGIRNPEDFLAIAGDAAQESPELVLNSLGLKTSGAGEGYTVQSGSVLLKAGMQKGDQLLSINGQMLGDIGSDQMLFEQVMGDGRARIEVQRGGRRFTINQNFGAYD